MSFKLGSTLKYGFSHVLKSINFATAVVDFRMKEGFVAQRFHNYMILKVLIIFRSKIKFI